MKNLKGDKTRLAPGMQLVQLQAAIVQSAREAIIGLDLDARVVWWNAGAEGTFGYTSAEMLGQSLDRLIDEEQLPLMAGLLDRATHGHLVNPFEVDCLKKGGQNRQIRFTVSPIRQSSLEIIGLSVIAHDVTEVNRLQHELAQREEELDDFFETAPVGIHFASADGTIRRANRTDLELMGYTDQQYVGLPFRSFHEDPRVADEILDSVHRGEVVTDLPAVLIHRDGTRRHVRIHASGLWEGQRLLRIRTVTRDVTYEQLAEREIVRLNRSHRDRILELQAILDVVPVGIAVAAEPMCSQLRINREFARIFGLSMNTHAISTDASKSPAGLQLTRGGRDLPLIELPLRESIQRNQVVRDWECDLIRQDGSITNLVVHVAPIRDDDLSVQGCVAAFVDVTERARIEHALREKEQRLQGINQKLRGLANRDPLTGVDNRRSFESRLEEELRRASRDHKPVSLLMIDIDFFKQFNDTYGHLSGDDCLVRVARTILYNVRRPADHVVRYGGEEFAVILPSTELSGATSVAQTIRRCVELLRIEHRASTVSPYVTVSVGVATCYPRSLAGLAALLTKSADTALYRAKRNGRNGVVSSQPEPLSGEDASHPPHFPLINADTPTVTDSHSGCAADSRFRDRATPCPRDPE